MNKLKQEKKERNKKDKEWRDSVIYKDRGLCAVCLKSKNEARLNCHHIFPRNLIEFRWDVMNGILLCAKHHKWGTYSAHKHGIWFFKWLMNNRPEQFTYLINKIKCEDGR